MTAATLFTHMDIHPAAAIFPMMADVELAALADDIKANGQREPVELLDGAILDGRNRYAACELAGVEPCFRTLEHVESPIHYVLSKNLHRRHLTTGQKASIAVEALPLLEDEARLRQIQLAGTRPNAEQHPDLGASLPQGPVPSKTRAPRARDAAGAAVGISGRSVAKAKEIMEKAPDLREQLRAGTLSLDKAAHQVRQRDQSAEPPQDDDRTEYTDDELPGVIPTYSPTANTATTLANAIDELVSIPVADIMAALQDDSSATQVDKLLTQLAQWGNKISQAIQKRDRQAARTKPRLLATPKAESAPADNEALAKKLTARVVGLFNAPDGGVA